MTSTPAPRPVVSPDGRWVWDGAAWRPAAPHLSEDGEWSWTGRYWEASARRRRVTLLMWLAAAAAGVALFALNGLVMYVADVPSVDRAADAAGLWIFLVLLDGAPVLLGALVAALARERQEARLVGVLAVVGGVLALGASSLLLLLG